jgi:hypothetical protein
MNSTVKILTVSCLVLIGGCGLTPEAKNRRVALANVLPEELVCGRVMGLEYFTGSFVPVNSFTKDAAIESMRIRNINCSKYTESLLRMNRNGYISDSLERDMRRAMSQDRAGSEDISKLQREVREMQQAERNRRTQQMTECIMRGGFVTATGCSK